jgi:hypothetical protein
MKKSCQHPPAYLYLQGHRRALKYSCWYNDRKRRKEGGEQRFLGKTQVVRLVMAVSAAFSFLPFLSKHSYSFLFSRNLDMATTGHLFFLFTCFTSRWVVWGSGFWVFKTAGAGLCLDVW